MLVPKNSNDQPSFSLVYYTSVGNICINAPTALDHRLQAFEFLKLLNVLTVKLDIPYQSPLSPLFRKYIVFWHA